jgi:hypothetical protein
MDGEAFCSLIHNRREVEVASDRKSWTILDSCFAGNLVALPRHGLFFLFEPWMSLLYLFYFIELCWECIVVDLLDGGDIFVKVNIIIL